jgi:nuclear transport factor 2 (NTF2) superfamily protein
LAVDGGKETEIAIVLALLAAQANLNRRSLRVRLLSMAWSDGRKRSVDTTEQTADNFVPIGTKITRTRAMSDRPPFPPFTEETAAQKARMAEDAWNGRDPERVSLAYTPDSVWRNRSEFLTGREAIVAFLQRKWAHELDYRLIKELWTFGGNRIAVRFAYEWRDAAGQWFRSYGNENWEFDANGLMRRRIASINDLPIAESDRKFHWPLGRRPDDHPGLSDLGL